MCDFATSPSIRNARLRFFDFLVKMWRLNERWCVIFPVPVTLNLFLALEFVFTLGILNAIINGALEAISTERYLGSLFKQYPIFYYQNFGLQK